MRHENQTRITGNLSEDRYTFLIISRSILLRMRTVSKKKNVVEKIKTLILCSITFFENHAMYEIMTKNTVEHGRPQMAIWHVRNACWVTKATNTHTEYVILIAFPLQQ